MLLIFSTHVVALVKTCHRESLSIFGGIIRNFAISWWDVISHYQHTRNCLVSIAALIAVEVYVWQLPHGHVTSVAICHKAVENFVTAKTNNNNRKIRTFLYINKESDGSLEFVSQRHFVCVIVQLIWSNIVISFFFKYMTLCILKHLQKFIAKFCSFLVYFLRNLQEEFLTC